MGPGFEPLRAYKEKGLRQHQNPFPFRRDGRVVDYNGLENRRAERHRGFESLSLRKERVTQVALSCVMREVDEKPWVRYRLRFRRISQFHDFTISQFHKFTRLPPAEQKKVTPIPLIPQIFLELWHGSVVFYCFARNQSTNKNLWAKPRNKRAILGSKKIRVIRAICVRLQ